MTIFTLLMTAWLPVHYTSDDKFAPGPEQKIERMSLSQCIKISTEVYNSYHTSFPHGKVDLCCIANTDLSRSLVVQ